MARLIELNIFERIAYSDEANNIRAQQFLKRHGVERARDQNDLAEKLKEVLNEEGEKVIPEFMSLHPDLEHFKANLKALAPAKAEPVVVAEKIEPEPVVVVKPESKPQEHVHNADCGCSFKNDGGEDKPATSFFENYQKHLPLIGVGLVFVSIGFGVLIAKSSSKSHS